MTTNQISEFAFKATQNLQVSNSENTDSNSGEDNFQNTHEALNYPGVEFPSGEFLMNIWLF